MSSQAVSTGNSLGMRSLHWSSSRLSTLGVALSWRALLGRAGRLFGAIGERVAVVEIVAVFLAFEHGIGFQRFLDFLLEVQGG